MNKIKHKYVSWRNKMKYAPTPENIKAINSTDWETISGWYNKLNSWGWPKELYPEIDDKIDYEPNQRRGQLMGLIKNKCGEKYISYRWNTHYRKDNDKMNEEEFEFWWNNRFNND